MNRFRATELEGVDAEVEFGLVLSGAKLIDNIDFREAICDYADGHKRENKQENQKIAAQNAAQFALHVMSNGGLVNPQ